MQKELAQNGAPDGKRLVLGFDAGCFTCRDLASRIEERVGEKIHVRNLRDPELQGWREDALGEDAKWAPTLFEVEDGKVRAWAGWRMGWSLSRAIGPAATWQVMQALGEVGAAPKVEESALVEKLPEKAAQAVVGMSRGQFLKGVGGTAVAVSMLSGAGALASPAAAVTRSPYDIVKIRKITGTQLATIAQSAAKTRDARNVAGIALSTPAKVRNATAAAFLHTLRNGVTVRAVVYQLPSARRFVHFVFSKPVQGTRTLGKLWQLDGEKNVLVKASENGRLWRRTTDARAQTESGGITPLGECPPVGGTGSLDPSCWIRRRVCVDYDYSRSCRNGAVAGTAGCGLLFTTLLYPPAGAVVATNAFTGALCFAGGDTALMQCCARYDYVCTFVCVP